MCWINEISNGYSLFSSIMDCLEDMHMELIVLCLSVLSNETNVMHLQDSSYKKRKRIEKGAYETWKSSVIASNKNKAKGFESISFSVITLTHCISSRPTLLIWSILYFLVPCKRTRQTSLNFPKEVTETQELEAM